MRILWNNEVFNATITASSEHPDYLFTTGLNDTRLSRYGKTLSDSEQWVKFSFSAVVDVQYVVIQKSNISSGATVLIQASSTDSWETSDYPEVEYELSRVGDIYYYEFSAVESYQYWRIYVHDPLNADGYIRLNYVFLGDYTDLTRMERGISIPKKSNSIVGVSESMQVFGSKKRQYIEAKVTIPLAEESSRTEMNSCFSTVDIVRPFIFIVWEDDLTTQPPFYARLTKPLSWQKVETENTVLYWTLTLNLQECF